MFKNKIKQVVMFSCLLLLLTALSGCYAVYEKEEYYENGQLKSKEYTKAWSVKAK